MAHEHKKYIKPSALLILLLIALIAGPTYLIIIRTSADTINTGVTVGNSAPTFTVNVAESTESSTTTPTNAGSNVTFQATGTDSNAENYYLAICKTNAITPTNGGAPTCDGGNWCISSSTSSGSQGSCSYTTLTGDSESNSWYAFVCDGNASAAACSTSSQGSGGTGSPFAVNHRPTFTSVDVFDTFDPGTVNPIIEITASDADTSGGADQVYFTVCKTSGITGTSCDGGGSDTWCSGTLETGSTHACGAFTLPSVMADGPTDAYYYVFDNHNFAASGTPQGANEPLIINNTTPSVSSVTLNAGTDVTLTESVDTNITVTATVTDTNSCQDLSTVTTSVYRSGVTFASCDTGGEDNNNNCYAVETCTVVGGTCTGATDASANYTCTVSIKHYADPTDTATQFTAQNWLSTVVATDDDAASANTAVAAGVEVLSLVAMNVNPASIAFGSLSPGQSNDPLDKITAIEATGNVGLDVGLSGTNLVSGGDNIAVGNQKYEDAASTAYAAGIALTGSEAEFELNVLKTTSATVADKDLYWGILIPNGTPTGSYSGTNTFTAIKSESGEW